MFISEDTLDELTKLERLPTAAASMKIEEQSLETQVVRQPQKRVCDRAKRVYTRRAATEKQPRKRAKAQIFSLRSQVEELQSLYSQLLQSATVKQQSEIPPATHRATNRCRDTFTRQQADVIEAQMLKDAHELNHRLKAALATMIQLQEVFQAELQRFTDVEAQSVERLSNEVLATTSLGLQQVEDTSSLKQIQQILAELETFHCDSNLVGEAQRETSNTATP